MDTSISKYKVKLSERVLNYYLISAIPFFFLVLGFFLDKPSAIFKGLIDIIVYPDLLLVDYLAVGGLGATFVNAGLSGLVCILIMVIYRLEVTGPLIAGIITVFGFAFMGKNIFNILPFFLGGILYSKFKAVEMKNVIVPVLFITTLAPVVTYLSFGIGLSLIYSLPLGILVGIVLGLVVAPTAAQFVKFHDGYNLYNIGFTGGILGVFIASVLRGFGFDIETQSILSTEYSLFIRNILIISSVFYIFLGLILNKNELKEYKNIFKHSGRLLTDYIPRFGYGSAYFNMGLMGLISVFYVVLIGGVFNGPVAAGVITIIAFSPFGKNPANCIPIFIGVFLGASLQVYDPRSTSMVIAALFGTTLAPIAGAYGFLAGILAGFLHVSVVTNVIKAHGGLNLYNNGFSGGLVAAVLSPSLARFFSKRKGIE